MIQPYAIKFDPGKFRYNKDSNLWIYPTKACDESGKFITDIDYLQAIAIAEQYGMVIPTSAQWSNERKWAQEFDERAKVEYMNGLSKERDYISGPIEFTGSLIDFSGKNTELWEKFCVRDGKLTGGKRKIVNWLPKKIGQINGFDEETGLATEVAEMGKEADKKYYGGEYSVTPKGLRIVIHGNSDSNSGPQRRYDMNVDLSPEFGGFDGLGFRLVSETVPIMG